MHDRSTGSVREVADECLQTIRIEQRDRCVFRTDQQLVVTLDRTLQIRLFISAALFLSGALGFELLSATQADEYGTSSLSYSVLYTIEESLEFAGLIFLVHTLLAKLAADKERIELNFTH